MDTKIAKAVQQAKTCAPICCDGENVCFTLAAEVERLYKLLELEFINECNASLAEPEIKSISIAEPTYDAPEPLWEAA